MKKLILALVSIFFCATVLADSTPIGNSVATPSAVVVNDADHDNEAIYLKGDLKIVPKIQHETITDLYCTVDAAYPQIEGTDLSAHAQLFNKLMSEQVTKAIEQFKSDANETMENLTSLPEELRKNSLRIDYDIDVVKVKERVLISVRLAIEGFQGGQAHPSHTYQVFNFNLTSGKELKLADLFKSKAKYLKLLSKYSEDNLNAKLTDKWRISEGTKPEGKNFKNWNIEGDALLITFDEDQVAPYASGPQEVEIPYGALKEVISPAAPIYSCVRHLQVCKGKKGKGKV